MRSRIFNFALCLSFGLTGTLKAQNIAAAVTPVPATAVGAAQRDPQAIAILTQATVAGGGLETLNSIQDFVESGTITYNLSKPATGTITVKGRGFNQFKIAADLPTGHQTMLVNGNGGTLRDPTGHVSPIDQQSLHDLKSLTLPALLILAAQQDTSTSIVYGGLVTHNGAQVHDVRFQKIYDHAHDPLGNRGAKEARDIYIDPNSHLVTAISDELNFGSSLVAHEIQYSNYQVEGGILMPLTISETVRGTTTVTIILSQATFNTGLQSSEFAF